MTSILLPSDAEELSPQVILMTPEEAAQTLSICAFERQRRIRAPWVAELSDILQVGNWEVTTITFAYCQANKQTYLVDGYHRLSAIVRSGIPAPLLVFRQVVCTLADVGVMYSRLDRGLPRSIADGLIAQNLPKQTELTATVLRAGVAAVNVIRAGFKHDAALTNKRSYDEKFVLLKEWLPEIRAYSEAIAGGAGLITRRLNSSAIMSVGLTVFKYQPEKALEFFHGISTAAGLEEGTPRHTMLQRVLSKDLSVRKVGTATLCRYTASCWNYHYDGKMLSKVQALGLNKPIILRGTPYTRWQEKSSEQP